MSKIKYTLYVLIITILFACDKDDLSSQQTESFIKLYGSYNTDIGNDVKAYNDGYLVLATVATANNDGKTDIAFIQTDKFGNTERFSTVAAGGGGVNAGGKLLLTEDGGFILVGTYDDTLNRNTDMYVGKYDANYDLEWEKKIGSLNDDRGMSIEKASSGYIIAGSTTKENMVNGNAAGSWDITLTKIDDSGNMEWENSFGGVGDDVASDLVAKNNKYLIFGTTSSFNEPGQANRNIIAIQTNLNGSETDKMTYGGTNDDYVSSAIETDDGGYLIIGTKQDDLENDNMYIVKVDNDIHTVIWDKSFGNSFNSEGFDIIKSDNGFVAVGSQSIIIGKAAYFLKFDNDGNVLVENTYGGFNSQIIYSVDRAGDDGFIMTGSSGFDGNDMICLLKANSEGEL